MTNNEARYGYIGKGIVTHVIVEIHEDGTARTACSKEGKFTEASHKRASCMPCRKEYRVR
jgi:hypothetical protein